MSDLSNFPESVREALLQAPALSPPPGVIPNFVRPPNTNSAGIAGLTLALVLSSIFLAVRIYVRLFIVKEKHVGDFLILPAYATLIGMAVLPFGLIRDSAGLYTHQWNVRSGDLPGYLFCYFISITLHAFSITLVKAAILIDWIHIFVPLRSRTSFFWICATTIALQVLFYASYIVFSNTRCSPYEKNWNPFVSGSCGPSSQLVILVGAILNLAFDVIVLLLPQRVIWRLQLSRKQKLGISAVFSLGLGTCIISGLRTYTLSQWILALGQGHEIEADATYGISSFAIWSVVEVAGGIVLFSAPTIPKAFKSLPSSTPFLSARARRRRSGKSSLPKGNLEANEHYEKPELPGQDAVARQELPDTALHELWAYDDPRELPQSLNSLRHELPGSRVYV